MYELHQHQKDAIAKLATGKILVGGVGSGKTITSLAYMQQTHPGKRIIAITTAMKRDSGEWWEDAMNISLRSDLTVDSWNNIKKYEGVEDACFIFDEQKIVGKGAWVQSFWKIAEKNDWILLTATPADVWIDLMPVFVANGFYKNQTEFNNLHVRWARRSSYPRIDGYYDEWVLEKHRSALYVEMPYFKTAERVEHEHEMEFSLEEQKTLYTARWNFYENQPVKDAGELMRLLRISTNSHPSRYNKCKELLEKHPRIIIFYSHTYELEILRQLGPELGIASAEWNGQKHQPIPDEERWVYLVQYQAGAEGWNCISTDQMIFYSLPYSYRQLEQAMGRIDRLNTPYLFLHYHIFRSGSIIDRAIRKALKRKKAFQAGAFAKKIWPKPVTQPTRLN